MFKSSFYKLQPRKIIYRNYKRFNNELYVAEVSKTLSQLQNVYIYENLEFCLLSILNRHAPLKEKVVRGNDKPFLSKKIRKEIYVRSRLKNKFNKTGVETDWISFKKQRNYVCALIKKEKKAFFSNIHIKPEEKDFWKACKPYLVSKSMFSNERITLFDNGKLVSDEHNVAHIFNSYFANILNTLNITHWNKLLPVANECNRMYPEEYSSHPSILKIKETNINQWEVFDFKHVKPKIVFDIITKLKKGSGELPIHILKVLKENCSSYLTDCINTAINNCVFPESLTWAEIIPIFKNKGEAEDKENYRPISILPTISKVFERVIFDQINEVYAIQIFRLVMWLSKRFFYSGCTYKTSAKMAI